MDTFHWVCLHIMLVVLLNEASSEDYKVILEKISPCDQQSSKLADISSLKVTKLNSTSVSFRGQILLNHDLSDDTTIKMTIQKYSLGSWITVPFRFPPHNICEFVKKDTYYVPILRKAMNFPRRCPFPKGTYQMNNAVVSIRKLPAYLPKGCFRIDTIFTTQQVKQPSCYSITARITGTVYKSLIPWIPLVPIAPKPICEFAASDNLVWKIIRERSTLPKQCPFVQGVCQFEDKKVTKKVYTEGMFQDRLETSIQK